MIRVLFLDYRLRVSLLLFLSTILMYNDYDSDDFGKFHFSCKLCLERDFLCL